MAFYSDFAGEYEKIFPLREGTLQFLDRWLPEDGRILDLGCGTGHYCGRLAKSRDRDCLGIDLDPGMILQAEKNYPEVSYQILDLLEVKTLKPGTFDGIYCIGNVLPHLPSADLPGLLSSVRKLLKPGGHWIFQTVNFDPLLHLDEYIFPALKFSDDQLSFHRQYLIGPQSNIIFQTSLMRDGENIFNGETTLYPRNSSEYLAMHRTEEFNLLAHFSDFSGGKFISGQSAGSVYVYESPEV